MSLRPNAPYRERIEDAATTLIYEGHDQPRGLKTLDPKTVDQPERYPSGSLTQNGKFHEAAQHAKAGKRPPERVRAYEKIRPGIWSYNGIFLLVDSWLEKDERRNVFKFRLNAVEGEEDFSAPISRDIQRRRIIPTNIKLMVWKRDGGQCVKCGEKDELHFDHILPWAKGGTSMVAENVQLLCARHNIQKSDRIE